MLFNEKKCTLWIIISLLATSRFTASQGQETQEPPEPYVSTPPITDPLPIMIDTPLSEITEIPCLHTMEGRPDGGAWFRYFNVSLQLLGICEIIERCKFERAMMEYFNEAVNCIGPDSKTVYFSGGNYNIEKYTDVIIYDVVNSTKDDECKLDVLLSVELMLTEDGGNIGECGFGCSYSSLPPRDSLTGSSFFPFAGGQGFRRLKNGSLKGKERSNGNKVKSKKITREKKTKKKKDTKKTKNKKMKQEKKKRSKNGYHSKQKYKSESMEGNNQGEEAIFYPTPIQTYSRPSHVPSHYPSTLPSQSPSANPTHPHTTLPSNYPTRYPTITFIFDLVNFCEEPLFLFILWNNGFEDISSMQFKEITMLNESTCDVTLFACIRTFCVDPGDDICYGLRNV